jgi:aryl-alcohol dehydrogenase-like predicted oxidoreductase
MVDLILGTAQLGLDYGVTNRNGRPSNFEAMSLLEAASRSGVTSLDTASDYGDSEFRLGELGYSAKFRIISKFQCIENHCYDINKQLKRLKLSTIYAMLFHNASQIASDAGLRYLDELRSLKSQDFVKKIGFSAYQIDEIEQALVYFPDLDIIQVPGNALDFRILDSTVLKDLASRGVEVHVRSVFLQGLLLADPSSISTGKFSFLMNTLESINHQSMVTNQSVTQFLINQIRNHPNVSSLVIGASTSKELGQIIKAWDSPIGDVTRILHDLDYEALDPRNWA